MAWNWLRNMWPHKKLAHWDVLMYTRKGCHLCEEAWTQLELARHRYEFTLRALDVDDNTQWQNEYGECVPVVVINGRVRFRGVINPVLLKRIFDSEG